jgi:class 3 adenylate cyclase/preprotein translocase subunit SecG
MDIESQKHDNLSSEIGSTTMGETWDGYLNTESDGYLLQVKGHGVIGLLERMPLTLKLVIMCFFSLVGLIVFAILLLVDKGNNLSEAKESKQIYRTTEEIGQYIKYLQTERLLLLDYITLPVSQGNLYMPSIQQNIERFDDFVYGPLKHSFDALKGRYGKDMVDALTPVETAQLAIGGYRQAVLSRSDNSTGSVLIFYDAFIQSILSMLSTVIRDANTDACINSYLLYLNLMELIEQMQTMGSVIYATNVLTPDRYWSFIYCQGTRNNVGAAWKASADPDVYNYYLNSVPPEVTQSINTMEQYIAANVAGFTGKSLYSLSNWRGNMTVLKDSVDDVRKKMEAQMDTDVNNVHKKASTVITVLSIFTGILASAAIVSAVVLSFTIVGPWRRLNTIQEMAVSKFVPKGFLKMLEYKSIADVTLGKYIEKDLTIMEVEISDFSTIRKDMKQNEVFQFLNAYLQHVGPLVRRQGGYIDRYRGERFTALFPDASRATRSCIEIHSAVESFNEIYMNEFPKIQIQSSVNTGTVLIGTVGEDQRMDCALIGHHSQVIEKLERLQKKFNSRMLMTKEVIAKSGRYMKESSYRRLGTITIESSQETKEVYEVFRKRDSQKVASKQQFESAVQCFLNGCYDKALKEFQEIVAHDSTDEAAQYYLMKSKYLADQTKYISASIQLPATLQDSSLFDGFEKFCHSEHSSENIMLWKEIDQYRQLEDPSSRYTRARSIVKLYFDMEAKYTVNITENTKQEVMEQLSKGSEQVEEEKVCVTESLFDCVRVELELNMKDTLKRYKLSPLFEEYFQRSAFCPKKPSLEDL